MANGFTVPLRITFFTILLISLVTILLNIEEVTRHNRNNGNALISPLSNSAEYAYSSNNRKCQLVNICILCVGSATIRQAVDMLHTLLMYRQTPIALYFVTDKRGAKILATLLETWQLPAVTSVIKVKTWSHPNINMGMSTGPEGAAVALGELVDLLPSSLEKIIIVDGSIRFLEDISVLWEKFHSFNAQQIIGITHKPVNHSQVRPDQNYKYYADVLLLDLGKMRSSSLLKTIKETAITNWGQLSELLSSSKAHLYTLPCAWNVKTEADFPLQLCLGDTPPKAVFWNMDSDAYTHDGRLERYKSRISTILTLNAHLLSQTQTTCFNDATEEILFNSSDDCSIYRYHMSQKRRTHLYYISQNAPVSDHQDITLATQMSLDRFVAFEKIAENWNGPISVAVHVTEDQARQLLSMVTYSRALRNRKNIDYHLVYRKDRYYPINYLRNVAIQHITSSFTFFVDVDLVPMPGGYEYLIELFSTLNTKRVAFVVPSLEAFNNLTSFPINKSQVLDAWKEKRLDGYKMYRGWNLGHKPTNFDHWKVSTEPYEVKFRDAFEPYVVLQTEGMPIFDELLLERMADKIVYSYHLYLMGYRFVVVDGMYLLHLPHPVSTGNINLSRNAKFGRCAAPLSREIQRELKAFYSTD